MALVTIEKPPNVTRFKGSVIKFIIGFIIRDIKDKTTPDKTKVCNPPEIFTPESNAERAARPKALMAVFLINDFMVFINPSKFLCLLQ